MWVSSVVCLTAGPRCKETHKRSISMLTCKEDPSTHQCVLWLLSRFSLHHTAQQKTTFTRKQRIRSVGGHHTYRNGSSGTLLIAPSSKPYSLLLSPWNVARFAASFHRKSELWRNCVSVANQTLATWWWVVGRETLIWWCIREMRREDTRIPCIVFQFLFFCTLCPKLFKFK